MRGTATLPLLAGLLGVAACGGADLPPRLPSTEAYERAATRVELVEFVISDTERAEKVRSLYIEIEQLMLETQKTEAKELALLGTLRTGSREDQWRASVDVIRRAETSALERYTSLQLEIRALTSAEEFARLDAIK